MNCWLVAEGDGNLHSLQLQVVAKLSLPRLDVLLSTAVLLALVHSKQI